MRAAQSLSLKNLIGVEVARSRGGSESMEGGAAGGNKDEEVADDIAGGDSVIADKRLIEELILIRTAASVPSISPIYFPRNSHGSSLSDLASFLHDVKRRRGIYLPRKESNLCLEKCDKLKRHFGVQVLFRQKSELGGIRKSCNNIHVFNHWKSYS